jgi:hypothetical protein
MNTEQKLSRELRKIEKRLGAALQPIKPPAAFVADLRDRLDQEMIKKTKARKVRNGLLVAGGVVGVVALVVTVIRKLTSWEKPATSIPKTFLRFRKREQAASIS